MIDWFCGMGIVGRGKEQFCMRSCNERMEIKFFLISIDNGYNKIVKLPVEHFGQLL